MSNGPLGGSTPPLIKLLLIEDNPGDARLIRAMLAGARGLTFEMEHVERLSA